MRLALLISGEESVSWSQWADLARICEQSGLDGLFRSDHYSSVVTGARGTSDAWATISALAAITDRIQLGTIVSPITFRHPSVLARMVMTASHISGGRVELGLGAGWHEREHDAHGFDFPSTRTRIEMLDEQLQILRLAWASEPFDFKGSHYRIKESGPLQTPVERVNVIVGGSAKPGTLRPAVRFADEYNTGLVPLSELKRRRQALNAACDEAGRAPLTFSVGVRFVVGETREAVRRRRSTPKRSHALPHVVAPPEIAGTVDEVVEQIREYADAGVDRLMLRPADFTDLEMIELIGREVIPASS